MTQTFIGDSSGKNKKKRIVSPASAPGSARKRIPAHLRRRRRDLSWIDLDSPYSEFLPARYREWFPDNLNAVRF
jgi:hypothetical protein